MKISARAPISKGWDDVLDLAFRIPHDASPRWLLMITAYVDETGQEQTDWMCVAGFMGDDKAWKKFRPEWKAAIFPRQHLHMKKLRFNRDSQRKMLKRAALVSKSCNWSLFRWLSCCRF